MYQAFPQKEKQDHCTYQEVNLKWAHKYGIELTKIWREAYVLDKKNESIIWADAIAKEMQNVNV